jgi:hypothetical protein
LLRAPWLTDEEQGRLEYRNRKHRAVSAIRELVEDRLDMDRRGDPRLPAMTATEVLLELGYRTPTNAQCKDCATVLRDTDRAAQ